MASTAISSAKPYTLPYTINSSLSTQKSSLSLHSHISFNSNFSKPNSFSLNKTRPLAPVRASLSDAVLVNTENYYDLLGISETGSIKEIKKAYKQLARKFHPDVSPAGKTEEFTKKFIQIQEAYETLSDPRSRAAYDRDITSGMGLHANFSARSRRSEPGIGDIKEWEQRWQSQLAELIRKSNSKEFESSSWGDKMRRRKSYSS